MGTVPLAGGRRLQLTPSGVDIPRILSWSPDANRIAFEWVYGIQIAKSDGSGTRTLAVNATSPSWCPDGTVIIYKASSPALVMVKPDGTDSTSVVPLKPEFSVVTWSPAPLP